MNIRRFDLGALVIGGVILLVGGFYLLRNTFGLNLGELDWEPLWPILVVLLGAAIVVGALTRPHGREPRQ
jgi:divalent metal cation (Fe/Co/Zn/Cd) transporter